MVTMFSNAEVVYLEGFRDGLRLDPHLTINEWADEKRILSQEGGAEPGKFRTSRTPYIKEIAECLSPSHPCERVVWQKAAQIAATELIINWIGYVIDLAPGPFLMVEPTVDLAKKISKQRIATAIRDTPCLEKKIKPAREKDSGNTLLVKEFPGGILMLTGANSAAGLRSMPIRFLGLDEVDSYPADLEGEGDPISLAIKRTSTFARRKIFITSTPTLKGLSRVESEYGLSDQRKYYVPCPHCDKLQVLEWKRIQFEHVDYKLISEVTYACGHCGCVIEERYKTQMLENGKWIPENSENGQFPGFHLSALYSPVGWVSWTDVVTGFLEFKKKRSKPLQKTWTNTVLAETWEDTIEEVEYGHLFNRREEYGEKIDKSIVIITAAVDVQDDRLEVTTYGWAAYEESFVLEHRYFFGDLSLPPVWRNLDHFLLKTYAHEHGLMRISCAAIDTGGHFTQQVYEFVKPREARMVFAIKGLGGIGIPIAGKPSKQKNGVNLFCIGTDTAKADLFGRLGIGEPGPCYIHFPMELTEEYFKQLTAEKVTTKYTKGYPKRVWEKIRDRNEALDMFVYGIAALYIVQCMAYPNYTVAQMLDLLARQINQVPVTTAKESLIKHHGGVKI